MKKISLLALAVWIIACLWGCGASDASSKQDGFAFTYNAVQITPGAEAKSILEALGEPKSYTEEPSCAFDGMDKPITTEAFICLPTLWRVRTMCCASGLPMTA